MQDKNRELREEIRWHEEQALTQGWGPGTGAGGSASTTPAPPSVPGAAHSGGAGPRVGTAQRAGVGSTAYSAARFEATGVVGAGSMDGRKVSAAVDQGRPLLSNTGMASARDTTTASRFASSAGKHLNGAASAHSTQNRPASVGSGSRMQAGVPGSGTFKELPRSASKAGADEYDGQCSFYGLAAGQASNERSCVDDRAYESGQGGWWGEATEGQGGMASEQGNGNSEQGEAEASLSGSGWEGAGHQVGGSMGHARSESPWPDEVSPGASEGSQGSPDAQHHAAGVQHTGPGRGALNFSQGQSGTRQHTAAHGQRGAASSTRSDRDLPPSAGTAASRQAAMRPYAAVHAGVQQQQQAWQPACSPASFAQGDMDEVCLYILACV